MPLCNFEMRSTPSHVSSDYGYITHKRSIINTIPNLSRIRSRIGFRMNRRHGKVFNIGRLINHIEGYRLMQDDGVKPKLAASSISSTFVKGMAVLKAFDDTHTSLTLAKIAEMTNLDRASVRRLTLTLVHLGYAEKDGRHFSLTPKVLILAGSFLRGNQFGIHIQPLLNRYADKIGASVSLAILDEDSAAYVAQSAIPDDEVSFGFTIGSRLPLLHTAIGRQMLAYGDRQWADRMIAGTPFEQYTSDTVMDRVEIAHEVSMCREQGYSVVDGEFEAGVTGIAVPVGSVNTLKAVVGTPKPSLIMRDENTRLQTISLLQQAALELGRSRMFFAR